MNIPYNPTKKKAPIGWWSCVNPEHGYHYRDGGGCLACYQEKLHKKVMRKYKRGTKVNV